MPCEGPNLGRPWVQTLKEPGTQRRSSVGPGGTQCVLPPSTHTREGPLQPLCLQQKAQLAPRGDLSKVPQSSLAPALVAPRATKSQ